MCVLRIAVRGLRSTAGPHRYIGDEDGQNQRRTLNASMKRLVTTPSTTGRGDNENQGALHVAKVIENVGSHLWPSQPCGREQRVSQLG